mmetsp:Transcript_56191/g.149306  ORF Transcript_56191/g.149306 Transcript_56191/m.149306 type:complete len:266 (-) Transcript_56191:497-1294(-)
MLTGVLSGATAATCAAPFIMTVDKAVTEVSAGKSSMATALARGLSDVFFRPHQMLTRLPFWMVAGVYGSTYATANTIDAICERALDPADERSPFYHGAVKLFTVTAVNMSAGVAKDAAFAKMFGAGGAKPPPVPMSTFGLFAGRDLLTIGAGFILPGMVGNALAKSGAMEEARANEVAQLISPMGMQFICTPIHLMALNMYNVPVAPLGERTRTVTGLLPPALAARIGRFGAAYGVGGLMNAALTKRGRDWALQQYPPPTEAAAR